jgi:hypothetical protein
VSFDAPPSAPDPTIPIGFSVVFDREVTVVLPNPDPEGSTRHIFRARVLEAESRTEIRVDLTDNTDIHIFLATTVLKNNYEQFKTVHKLRVEFDRFAESLSSLLTTSVERPKELQLKYTQPENGGGSLSFFQQLRLRSVTILTLEFEQQGKEFVTDYVQKKFTGLKIDLEEKRRDFEPMLAKIDEKNPSLSKPLRQTVELVTQQRLNI